MKKLIGEIKDIASSRGMGKWKIINLNENPQSKSCIMIFNQSPETTQENDLLCALFEELLPDYITPERSLDYIYSAQNHIIIIKSSTNPLTGPVSYTLK